MQLGLPPNVRAAFPDVYRYAIIFICSLHAFHFHFQVFDYSWASTLFAFVQRLGICMFVT